MNDELRLAQTVVRNGDTVSSALDREREPETVGTFLRRKVDAVPNHLVYLEKRDGAFAGVSWERFGADVAAFASFLHANGVLLGDRVVAIARNRGELLVAEFAVMSIGAIYVPLFAGYGGEQLANLMNHAEPTAVVAEAAALAKAAPPQSCRVVVTFEPTAGCTPFGETLNADADLPIIDFPHAPCLMMYTSGTTGQLKGVLLSHDSILSQQHALARIRTITSEDRFLSYLPWHHSFGGLFEKYSALYNDAPLAIDDSYGKDFDVLLANWLRIRPTVYFSVPKVYQDLVNRVQHHPEEEDAVFHDALKFVFTAAAPLPRPVSDYFAGRGIPVVEGWGLTETAPCCTVTDFHEARNVPGCVGYPIPGVTLKVADDGEILIRGPNVMKGYFRNAEATRDALPGDGWFHTGDLGVLEGNALKLVARKDRIFKLLNAEKVNPTPIELKLADDNRYIRHVVVAGSGEGFLSALIFPDFDRIEADFGDDTEKADRVVKTSFRQSVQRLNDDTAVRYEHVRAFAVVSKELTLEEGELTPSLKVRVRDVLANAENYVESIYHPTADCDCRFLKKVMRLHSDTRPCFRDKACTLDECHTCGPFVFPEP